MGFEKFFCGQVKNQLDKLKMIGWNSLDITLDVKTNELFLPAGLALRVLYRSSQSNKTFEGKFVISDSLTKIVRKRLETI